MTTIALLGCVAGLAGPAAGAEKADPAAAVRSEEKAGLERRISTLRQERRMRLRTTALLSEMALFDDGTALGRSVAFVEGGDKGPVGPPVFTRGPEAVVQREMAGLGGTGRTISGGDIEGLESEIQGLEMRLRSLKKGARRS